MASQTLWSVPLCLNLQPWGWYSRGQSTHFCQLSGLCLSHKSVQSAGSEPLSTCCVHAVAPYFPDGWGFKVWLFNGSSSGPCCEVGLKSLTRLTLTDNYWEYLSFKPLILAVPDIKGTECLGVDMLANQGILFVCKSVFDLSVYFVWLLFLQCAPCTWTVYTLCLVYLVST